jgi:DNA-binding transcriptional MerR regulator
LRYYEKIGLIRDLARKSGRRDYGSRDMVWLEFIQRLKNTNMPLKEIKRYSDLRYAGDKTISERKAMLLSHKERLKHEIKKLQAHLEILEAKIGIYEKMEQEHESLSKGAAKTGGD